MDKNLAMIKVWTPLLTAALALIGTISLAVIQGGSANKKDISAVFEQINSRLIVDLQSTANKLYDSNLELRERIVRLETLLNEKFKKMPVPRMWGEDMGLPVQSKPIKVKRDLPKLQKLTIEQEE